MQLRPSLELALTDIEAGILGDVTRVVVNRLWWDELSRAERDTYHGRCVGRGVSLSADDRISRHFVEVVSENSDPPLSTERHA